MLAEAMHVLTVGTRYDLAGDAPAQRLWPALAGALRARGDSVAILTTDDPGHAADDDVQRSLRWFWGESGWRRPARLEASRIARHDLRMLGEELQRTPAAVVVWVAMGGLPLTLVGASGRPELALVLDDWPVLGPRVDPNARRDGWDPGAVTAWSCADAALAGLTRGALPGGALPGGALPGGALPGGADDRVAVDPATDPAAWTAAVVARLDEVAAAGPAG
jgi:hypothetical protein